MPSNRIVFDEEKSYLRSKAAFIPAPGFKNITDEHSWFAFRLDSSFDIKNTALTIRDSP